jgi:hypothetical protein
MARKLWLASRIQGHRNPFGKPLIEYSMAQLDFVLEMAAIDEPDMYSFVRRGVPSGVSLKPRAFAGWTNVLMGRAKVEIMERLGLTRASAFVAAWKDRRMSGPKLGITRGGKRIGEPDADDPRNRDATQPQQPARNRPAG